MKKIYQIPTTTIVKIETTQMIATSIDMYGKNAEGAGMSRRGNNSVWDDDEDYNEDYDY